MTTVQKFSALVLAVIAFVAIYYLQSILTPFLVGMVLAYLGDPVVDWLETYKINRTVGVLIVFVVFLVLIVGVALVVVPMLVPMLLNFRPIKQVILLQRQPQGIGILN